MKTGLYDNDFSRVFAKFLGKAGVSCYQISQYTGIDQGYLSRLRNGEKCNPSAGTIMKISLALAYLSKATDIHIHDFEELFRSVGRTIYIGD